MLIANRKAGEANWLNNASNDFMYLNKSYILAARFLPMRGEEYA
jgi:hypothetical protein